MDRDDVRQGIMLFQYSDTARRGGHAPDLIERLWRLYRRNEIALQDLGPAWHHGEWGAGPGPDLRINTAYLESLPSRLRLGALSLLLVHEGMHATVNFTRLYDELAARILPVHYFRELSGPGVFNEASDPPRPGGHTEVVQLPSGSMPSFDRQSEALRHDRLIDYVLSIDTYTRPRYVNPRWIINNITNWHGLGNRWPETRGLYIRVLAPTVDAYFTRAIPDIMESIGTREDWDAMMEEAGSLRTIQIALGDLSARREYATRIVALERRWGVHLREEPPER
jgi:hypothetical protein